MAVSKYTRNFLALLLFGSLMAARAAANQAPVAEACDDRSTSLPDPVWITASATDDGLPGGSLTVQWSRVSGPGSVTFTNPATYYTYASFSTQGIYGLRFTAYDGELSGSDDVTITVGSYGNQRPWSDPAYQLTAVVQNAEAYLEATVTDDGIPSGVVAVTWSQVGGPGTITFANIHHTDTTARFSIDGLYSVRLTATDGELTDSCDINVYVDPAYASNRLPLANQELGGSGSAPTNWSAWGSTYHDPDAGTFRTPNNSWRFTGDGGIYQQIPVAGVLDAGFVLGFGGYLRTPSSDPLRNGTKHGSIELQFYGNTSLFASVSAPPITQSSSQDVWVTTRELAALPAGATTARVQVLCADADDGDGRFLADDIAVGYGAATVDSGVISNYCALAVVAGRPAAVYKRNGELIFAINQAADGRGSWATSVVDTNGTWIYPSLAEVNGRPAVAYRRNSTGHIKFAVNSEPDGSGTWSVQVVELGGGGLRPSLVEVDGRPAFCALATWDSCNPKWCNPHQDLKFYINSAPDGSGAWTITTVTNGWRDTYNGVWNDISDCAMAIVNGRPAIAYNQGYRGIWFTINSSADGSGNWNAFQVSSNNYPHMVSLASVAGKPMVACSRYYNSYPRGLYLSASSTSDGSGPWTSSLVGEEDNVRWHQLTEIDGKPAIAFLRGGQGKNTALYYTKNATSDASGAWTRYDLHQDVKQGENCALAAVVGRPAVAFCDRDGSFKYLGGRNASAWMDSDGDEMGDGDEERAGTDPFNRASFLDILSVVRGAANAQVQWCGGTGVAQYLEYRTNLLSGGWVCLYSNLPPMSATNTVILPNGDGRGYYRIRVHP
jgi:hypothetical protein